MHVCCCLHVDQIKSQVESTSGYHSSPGRADPQPAALQDPHRFIYDCFLHVILLMSLHCCPRGHIYLSLLPDCSPFLFPQWPVWYQSIKATFPSPTESTFCQVVKPHQQYPLSHTHTHTNVLFPRCFLLHFSSYSHHSL